MKRIAAGLLPLLAVANAEADELLRALTADRFDAPIEMTAFRPNADAMPADAEFSGRLLAPAGRDGHYTVRVDSFGLQSLPGYAPQLPDLAVSLVQSGEWLIPEYRHAPPNRQSVWEFLFAPGRVWKAAGDRGWNRAALPFTLRERNADCMHYGVLAFRFNASGAYSDLVYQVVSQTCGYYQFTLAGRRPMHWVPAAVPNARELIDSWASERASRLRVRPLSALADDYPGANPAGFGSKAELPPQSVTTWGFVIDGVHYAGGCPTPLGEYPFCDELSLPSYSLAKSLFAGLAVARAELLFPGISDEAIADWVPECAERAEWSGVTIAHAMDMATGNFDSADADADENAMVTSPFFVAEEHSTKARVACNAFERNALPGTAFVYHTSDMYLAGAALAAVVRERAGEHVDLYTDLIVEPLWRALELSPLTYTTRRTNDAAAQPFFAWGLAFYPDDLVRIGGFLLHGGWRINGRPVLDAELMAAALQRNPQDRGLDADIPGMKYRNGFRGFDVAPYVGCTQPAWVNVLSGYGGIVLILMPNDTLYYYVSDGYVFRWMEAARASHRIRPFCDSEPVKDHR